MFTAIKRVEEGRAQRERAIERWDYIFKKKIKTDT